MIEYDLIAPQFCFAARQLCLDAIAEIFEFSYDCSWAYDLDSLGTSQDQYSRESGGAFFVALQDGNLIGAAGVRAFKTLSSLPGQIVRRYPLPEKVCTLMRAYVRSDMRELGVGSSLVRLCEKAADEIGYDVIYMHTHCSTGRDPVDFWTRCGYQVILQENDTARTVHLEKCL